MHHWAVKDWHRESKCVTVPRRASSNVYFARSARCATVPRRAAMNWHRQLQLEGSDKFSAWFIYRNLRYYLIIRRLKSTSFLSYVVWPAAHEWLPLYRQDIVKRPWGSQRDTNCIVLQSPLHTDVSLLSLNSTRWIRAAGLERMTMSKLPCFRAFWINTRKKQKVNFKTSLLGSAQPACHSSKPLFYVNDHDSLGSLGKNKQAR